MQPLRPAFLDYLSAAQSRQTKNDHRVRAVTTRDNLRHGFVLEDDDELDDEDDEFDDEFEELDDEFEDGDDDDRPARGRRYDE